MRGLPCTRAESALSEREAAHCGDEKVERSGGRGVVDGAGSVGYADTAFLAGGNVDLVVASAMVRDPADAGWERVNELVVEAADARRRVVAPVESNCTVQRSVRLEGGKEVGAASRFVELLGWMASAGKGQMELNAYNDVCNTVK